MLTTVILPVLLTCALNVPSTSEIQAAKEVNNIFKWAAEKNVILIAGGRRSAPGPDHGDDPNDEQHQDIPAWEERNKHKPPSDPYAGTTPNNRNDPYKPY